VQSALINEKTRQLAVFHAKQDERKSRKIEFEFGKLEEMQNKVQELHNVLKKGQEVWNSHNESVAKLIDHYMQDEAHKARTITEEKQDAEATIVAKYQADIAAHPEDRANLVQKQTDAVADIHASKVRELQLMSQQQSLTKLSAMDDLIDTQQKELATQLATEDMLKKLVTQLEVEASSRRTEIEMDMSVEAPPALLQKLELIKAEHNAREKELQAQMEQELAEFALNEEQREKDQLQKDQAELVQQQEQQRMTAEIELKMKLDAATDGDAKRIMAEHQAQQKAQQTVFADERKLRQEKMQARLREKKARKQAELASKMNQENDVLLADKQQDMRETRRDAFWNAEMSLVQQQLDSEQGNFDVNRVKAVVQNVLENRHNQELLDLASDLLGAKVRAIQTALGPVNSRWEAELRDVQGTAQEEATKRQLHEEVQAVREQVAKKFEFDSEVAEVALKKTHLEETLQMISAAAPQYADQVRGKIDSIKEVEGKSCCQNDSEARMQELLQMKGDLALRKHEEIDAALAEIDAQASAEAKEEQTKLNQQISKLQKQKQNAIFKKTNEQELVEMTASSDNERNAMQMSHRAEMMDFTRLLNEEEERQKYKLEEKVQQRRDTRMHKRRAFERQLKLQFKQHEDALATQMTQVQVEKTAALREQKEELESFSIEYQAKDSSAEQLEATLASMAMEKNKREAAAPVVVAPVAAQSIGDLMAPNQFLDEMQMQITKPLMSRIESIESLLVATGAASGGKDIYIDSHDAQWKQARGSQVVPVEAGQLSTTQESVFKSAQQALSVLPQGMHRIRSIVPAKELPVTMNSSNAFSESYNFDAASGRLAIRAERFSSVGEMMTILAHANAHIQCGTMDSDQDPRFQREFYSTVNTLLLSSHQQQKKRRPSMDRQKYNSQRDPESAINILADHKIAEAELANQQHRQEATQKEGLERKLTERSAKREAQVRSIMKSKLSGGSARVTKNQARAQKNQVKKLFDSVDADNNGSLDSVEVTGLLELLGVSLSADERGELVKQFGNDRVEFELFYQWYSN